MIRRLLLASILSLWAFCAHAAGWLPLAQYVGPGDIQPGANLFYGLRAYNSTIARNATLPLVNIQNGTSSVTCDVLPANNGGLGLTANCSSGGSNGQTTATFCTGATCYITEWYDQSGDNYCSSAPCNYLITPQADQPVLTQNCLNTLPCAVWPNVTPTSFVTFASIGPPWSVEFVGERTGSFTQAQFAVGSANNVVLEWTNAANHFSAAVSGVSTVTNTSVADSVLHAFTESTTSTVATLNVDGTSTASSTATTSAFDFVLEVGYNVNGRINEVGVWPVAFGSTGQTNMCHNARVYWGTIGTC